jgi:hypothetical protein
VGKLEEIVNLEDLGISGIIISTWVSEKWDWVTWTGLIWLRIGTGGGI